MTDDPLYGPPLTTMVHNLLSSIHPSQLIRVTLDNNVTSALSVDNFVGRAAHISFLDNPIIAAQIIYSLYQYFQ